MSQAIDSQISVILLDIEGTTTPVDFVYRTLFPYAVRKLPTFIQQYLHEPETNSLIQNLYWQHQTDQRHGLKPPVWIDGSELRSSVSYAQWLMDKNSKHAALKALQGKIWQEGYNTGELQGQVYADVPQAFKRWQRQKRKICIYSSGSVLAQQQLFRTVELDDLTPYITAYFDSNIGAKTETESYKKIAETSRRSPHEFLFVSDTKEEVEAASDAGMHVILCDRVHHHAQILKLPRANLVVVSTFDEIFPD